MSIEANAATRISEANDAAHRISQLRASLATLKANPSMSITHNMATGPDGKHCSPLASDAVCFCILGRVARDHSPSAVYDADAVFDWLDNIFFQPFGGDMASFVTTRLMSLNDHAETTAQRFAEIEHYIDTLEAKFVRGEPVDVFA